MSKAKPSKTKKKTFSLREIIDAVNSEYPDGHLALLVDKDGKPRRGALQKHDDTLAFFIVSELHSLDEPEGNDAETLEQMRRAMLRAADELVNASDAIGRLREQALGACEMEKPQEAAGMEG
jgi:hypothetical protein